jgi:NADH/NAD ratio-sensing transcriptional regulator Rex
LGLSEETVRHDLSYVRAKGRPGSGYDTHELYDALRDYLDLSAAHPFAAIGNQDILRGLSVTFPAEDFGLSAAVYFSERAEDVGALVGAQPVHALADIPKVASDLGIRVALVAVAPLAVEATLELLSQAGVHGVVMLTPVLRPAHPEGMSITYFRMPCALKSLVNVGVPACGCEQG